ncbi:MAG: hypothetical protein JSS25_00130 [Proteobacteria bacterium]|nr:hypothetical protein [Pseudomonadota bacterium]
MRWLVSPLLGIAASVAAWKCGDYDQTRLWSLGASLASVSGVVFGFMLTALAMIVTMPERQLTANMRKTGHHHQLLVALFRAAALHFVTLAFALSAAFLTGNPLRISVMFAIGLEVISLIETINAGHKLWLVLDVLGRPDSKS